MALIAVDGRFLGTGTGLANYTKHLLQALVADGRHNYIVLTRAPGAIDLDVEVVAADIAHYSVGEQARLPRIVSATGCDLAFYPHFNAPVISATPFVITVHDLILHRFPGDASLARRAIYRTLLQRNLRAARHVIAVSEWTRQDLIKHYGPGIGDKTTVSGEGAGDAFTPRSAKEVNEVRARLGLVRPYVLYAGNAKPHKNLDLLATAHRASQLDEDLVLVTGDPDAARHTGRGVVIARGIDDNALAALYSGARAFVTASLDEGYCLPVAEALACGCPVIASDCGAIPETAQGHARLVPPTVEAWTQALKSPVTTQPAVRLGEWEDAAGRTVEAFNVALGQGPG